MAKRGGKDLISKLADAGEDALHRVSELPGAGRLVTISKDRLDDLTKRMRGLEALEQRIAALERKVGGGTKAAPKKRTTATAKRSTSTAKKKTT